MEADFGCTVQYAFICSVQYTSPSFSLLDICIAVFCVVGMQKYVYFSWNWNILFLKTTSYYWIYNFINKFHLKDE